MMGILYEHSGVGRWHQDTCLSLWPSLHEHQDEVGSRAQAAVTEVPGSRELGGAGLRLTQEFQPSQSADRQKHLLAITGAWPFLDVRERDHTVSGLLGPLGHGILTPPVLCE